MIFLEEKLYLYNMKLICKRLLLENMIWKFFLNFLLVDVFFINLLRVMLRSFFRFLIKFLLRIVLIVLCICLGGMFFILIEYFFDVFMIVMIGRFLFWRVLFFICEDLVVILLIIIFFRVWSFFNVLLLCFCCCFFIVCVIEFFMLILMFWVE